MFNFKIKKNKGFTLVETMVAVFILSMIIISLMAVVARSLFASRYARDEITANYLLQEAVDYIRNDRDTFAFLASEITNETWENFIDKYKNCEDPTRGCYVDVYLSLTNPTLPVTVRECPYNSNQAITTCPKLLYNPNSTNSFYNYDDGQETNFRRKIMVNVNPTNRDEIIVEAIVYWVNGDISKSRSLKTSLWRWQF